MGNGLMAVVFLTMIFGPWILGWFLGNYGPEIVTFFIVLFHLLFGA